MLNVHRLLGRGRHIYTSAEHVQTMKQGRLLPRVNEYQGYLRLIAYLTLGTNVQHDQEGRRLCPAQGSKQGQGHRGPH